MNNLIRKAISNTPAMNTLMVALLAVGAFSVYNLRREVFPEFELEIILISVPYPGASPAEVEEGICQKIEEAVFSVDGIKKQTSVAREGLGSVILELKTTSDPQRILNEVRSEVDRIPSFPLLAEDPEVKQITLRQPAITVGVIGPDSLDPQAERQLRDMTEMVRDELVRLPTVSQADIVGAKEYQIDVEIGEDTLRRYGLTLQQVAQIIRRENLELPGGTIRTDSQDILVKGKNKGTIGSEIESIPIITQPNGVVLAVRDLGTVRDEFADIESYTRIDGKPGMAISVTRTSDEDLLTMTDAVLKYVAERQMPNGYKLITWGDRSIEVRDRLETLANNGIQGLILVVVMLALFLSLRLSFWVAAGIPISILGACAVLYFSGQTLNMLTTFTFVMALGIVVDDAIVISENIHAHYLMGKSAKQAAIDGTLEVAPSVCSSVATTIIAFVPLFFVSGVMGKFIAVMPLTMISVLLFSLFEATFVLPCHLAHEEGTPRPFAATKRFCGRLPVLLRYTLGPVILLIGAVLDIFAYPYGRLKDFVDWLNVHTDRGMQFVIDRIYLPTLRRSLRNPLVPTAIGIALLVSAFGLIEGGIVPFVVFPKLDSNTIDANVVYPDGTPASVTEAATKRMEEAIYRVNDRYAKDGKPVLKLTRRSVGYVTLQDGPRQDISSTGGNQGAVTAELLDVSERSIESQYILAEWRKEAGSFPGAETVTFGSQMHGPGGKPIEFKLLAPATEMAALEAAVDRTKNRLAEFDGVHDISDDSQPGKWEFQLKVKPDAVAMGVPLQQIAETVRASYYGEEVMRLQRGRHEVKLMVRYPKEDRRSLAEFDQVRIRDSVNGELPLTELADVKKERSYTEINRVDQLRSITISADVDETKANARQLVATLQNDFLPTLFQEFPAVSVRWEGQQEQTAESINSMMIGLSIALVAMFVLLTLEFTSYFQPMLIMAIIPFGIVGAVYGHALMGMPLTMFSLFGLVTLTGIVVNDSIVLIDFINHRARNGMPLHDALMEAGARRLRPIFLTSVTTIAGLFPLVLETSFQAQILIPMAVSICGGLFLSTILCLYMVPVFYQVHAKLTGVTVDGMIEQQADESSSKPEEALLPA